MGKMLQTESEKRCKIEQQNKKKTDREKTEKEQQKLRDDRRI